MVEEWLYVWGAAGQARRLLAECRSPSLALPTLKAHARNRKNDSASIRVREHARERNDVLIPRQYGLARSSWWSSVVGWCRGAPNDVGFPVGKSRRMGEKVGNLQNATRRTLDHVAKRLPRNCSRANAAGDDGSLCVLTGVGFGVKSHFKLGLKSDPRTRTKIQLSRLWVPTRTQSRGDNSTFR
jgi:hypothetical protein